MSRIEDILNYFDNQFDKNSSGKLSASGRVKFERNLHDFKSLIEKVKVDLQNDEIKHRVNSSIQEKLITNLKEDNVKLSEKSLEILNTDVYKQKQSYEKIIKKLEFELKLLKQNSTKSQVESNKEISILKSMLTKPGSSVPVDYILQELKQKDRIIESLRGKPSRPKSKRKSPRRKKPKP